MTFEAQVYSVTLAPVLNDVRSMFPSDEVARRCGVMKEKDQTHRYGRLLYFPTTLEEPNSFNSEEDDPLPGVENLQIVGDAVPGSMLQACGFSINGTTLCVFQWVRHLQDGTMVYIEGASQPDYTVTADDVDALIAIECVPIDDRNRKGELVKVFANDQNKITCDPTMQEQIECYFFAGQAVFDVQLSVGMLDIWEPAVLTLERSTYEIKGTKPCRDVVHEKYTSELCIVIPYGHEAQFMITNLARQTIGLRLKEDNMRMRDAIVLTMKLFKKQALERRKGEKMFHFLPKLCVNPCFPWMQALKKRNGKKKINFFPK
ncbi:uncharacterized protein LOC131078111 isoform X1 [Cryptomeria japonica]|uniref:uncharacterized protein LOC131078111 isoform X1 n=2 Tax=Cryptomeria japonica TaxID=3369 RepID=UPI0027DA2BF6|nr:uncharacterized protein LOC131078111 isoform X1 [Cryptomeria japonica]